ncbi:MAG: mersacidin/lichenicidin family type 2 lantibiotic [Ilumatobacteraceae bacterium]
MIDTIRVWKDAAYRKSLSAAQLAGVPAHPAGGIELSDTELDAVTGGMMKRSDLSSLLSTCTSGTESCCC